MRLQAVRTSISEKLFRTFNAAGLLRPGERICVAVSGGADSVALLLLLLEWRKKLGVVLSVAHFNHKLRRKASDADEKFVAGLAKKYGLEFNCGSADVKRLAKKEKANLEDAARRARYEYFRALVESGVCDRIAVAQTADDQAETVLAHLLRGTGLKGLGGIHPVAGVVIRPLLGIRRKELRKFLRARKQKWREDATNRDTSRLRARIRKKLLPLLERQFQPRVVEHLATLADLAREDESALQELAENQALAFSKEKDGGLRIPAGEIAWSSRENRQLQKTSRDAEVKSVGIRKRMVREIIARIKPGAGQLGAAHVDSVLQLAASGKSGSRLDLPGGVEVRKIGAELEFRAREGRGEGTSGESSKEYEYPIELKNGAAEIQVPEAGCVFRLRVIDWARDRGETRNAGEVLDRDRLVFPLALRNWRPGDRLRPEGRRGSHKLKRLFNAKRISRWERAGWPVLTSGDELVWARGFPVAAEFAAREGTREGILIAEEEI